MKFKVREREGKTRSAQTNQPDQPNGREGWEYVTKDKSESRDWYMILVNESDKVQGSIV